MWQWLYGSMIGWIFRQQVYLLAFLAGCIGRAISRIFKARKQKALLPALQEQSEMSEREAGCKRVVLDFAATLGYMTRECMEKKELESLIDSGITPDDLAKELHKRVEEIPGVTLGKRHFQNGYTDIKLPYSLRDRHVYICGRSGSGKTNILRFMATQDIWHGCGIGVLVPEKELIEEQILPYIPAERVDDVVYINPADSEYPVAFNPLHLDIGEDIGQKVDDFVTVFKRAVGDTGFRMDQILSETLYALIRRPGSTLDDIERFLSRSNPAFRNEVLKSADERTRFFFEDTYPSMDRNAANPVLSRISGFTKRDKVRNILCQPGQSFSFRRAMDEGKIILINLSDGMLGEQASQLLGQIFIAQFQLAAMSRADTVQAERVPFYLYLDEFQSFCGVAETSYEKILSRARRYALGLILAHQQTGQISQKLLKEILGNVTTFITFNVSYEDATKLSSEYAYEYGQQMEFVEPKEFLRLRQGEALCKIDRTVFPIETYLMPQQPDHRRAQAIIERSRQNYGRGGGGNPGGNGGGRPTPLPKLPSSGGSANDPELDPKKVF